MESHEALARAVEERGAKAVAQALGLSTSLVYKWCEPDEGSGARNPLDRIAGVVEATGSRVPLEWLCRRAGGLFVQDPEVAAASDADCLAQTQQLLAKFSELLQVISRSLHDGVIDGREAEHIRAEWDALRASAEAFVRACEAGRFHRG
jgi:hypothetical protein